MMQNVSILKTLFLLKIFKFLPKHHKTYLGKWLDKKVKVFSTFITLQPAKETIKIHTFPNNTGSKGNQTMKFGHLKEYNVRNIFIQNSYRK